MVHPWPNSKISMAACYFSQRAPQTFPSGWQRLAGGCLRCAIGLTMHSTYSSMAIKVCGQGRSDGSLWNSGLWNILQIFSLRRYMWACMLQTSCATCGEPVTCAHTHTRMHAPSSRVQVKREKRRHDRSASLRGVARASCASCACFTR